MNANSVLIIDDDEMFRSLIKEILASRGLDVIEAASGQEAFDHLDAETPVLALVDYRLPEMDGISWITQLRERGKNIPVVFISATWCDSATFNRLRGLLKVSLILQKPINPDLFMQQVESLLPPG